jgi:UDP-2,3-diacylglucosamine hydrolase
MTGSHAPLFFVSDAHLGAGTSEEEKTKSEKLHAFWDYVLKSGGDLVVVGDLFDFWFEFRHAIPSAHFDHLAALRQLVESGRKVTYVAGNHDFWAGRFFQDQLGIAFHPDEYAVNLDGKQVVFAHGDGWLPSEHGYRFMRRVLRHPFTIRVGQMISPDIGYPFARWLSGRSRGKHRLDSQNFAAYGSVARIRLIQSADVLVTGHLHEVRHLRWPDGDWLITGDWIQHFTFGVIENGVPRLMRWDATGNHRLVEPEVVADPLVVSSAN